MTTTYTAPDSKWNHMTDYLMGIIPATQEAANLYTQTFLLQDSIITGYHTHEAKKPSSKGLANSEV